MFKHSHCVDVWNPDHESLVTNFFQNPDQQYNHQLGNGLLVYHHQLMHDVLVGELPQYFAIDRKDVRDEIEKIERELRDKMGWEKYDEVRSRINRLEQELEELCFEGKRAGSAKCLSFNEELNLRAAQVRTANLTLIEKYGRLHLSGILQRASDITDAVQGPPPDISRYDWEELMRVRTKLRTATTSEVETWENYMTIMEEHDTLTANIHLCDYALEIPGMQPRNLLSAVEDLSQCALKVNTGEENLRLVQKTYPFLHECHTQLRYVRELLREGTLVEQAYEQILKLVRHCLQEGEKCLSQKHPLFFREVLEYLGCSNSTDHIYEFLQALSKEDFEKQYQASQETRKFYDFVRLHEPNQCTQRRAYQRASGYQSHICDYSFSAISRS